MKFKTGLLVMVLSILILVNLPVYGQILSPSTNDSPTQFMNSLDKYKQIGSLVSEDRNGSGLSFMPAKTVIWYNDLNSPVIISSELFDNVTLQKGEIFSYEFSTPGTYWIHFNNTNRLEINVENVMNDCTIDGNCGNPTDPTICKQFGKPDFIGICSDPNLEKAAEAEFERRDNVTKQIEIESDEKTKQEQAIQVQLSGISQQESSLDREKLGENEYMKEYSGFQNQMEPLENQINQLEDEIRTLQSSSPTYSCVKDAMKYFVCTEDSMNTTVGRTNGTNSNPTTPTNSTILLNQTYSGPTWTKKIFQWYDEGKLTENELFSFVKYMMDNKIMEK